MASKALADTVAVVRKVWTHPSNRDQRVQALGRAVGYQLRARVLRQDVVGAIGEHGRILVRLHDSGSSQVIYANPPDHAEMIFWKSIIRRGDLMFDVGANVGVYALWFADLGAEVVGFEPDCTAAARLRENAQLSGLSVDVREIGLAATSGEMLLSDSLGTSNRLLTDESAFSGRKVRLSTLDGELGDRRARGMKIDVEGAERQVLEGGVLALRAHRIDVIQLEWNQTSERNFGETRLPAMVLLRDAGYRPFILTDGNPTRLDESGYGTYRDNLFACSPAAAVELGLN